MTTRAGIRIVAIAMLSALAACSTAQPTACRCPTPVAYNDATIKKITAALRALPSDSVLHQTMDDYEDERDDLRQCLAGAH